MDRAVAAYIVFTLTELIVRLSKRNCLGCKDKKKSHLLHRCKQVSEILLSREIAALSYCHSFDQDSFFNRLLYWKNTLSSMKQPVMP